MQFSIDFLGKNNVLETEIHCKGQDTWNKSNKHDKVKF